MTISRRISKRMFDVFLSAFGILVCFPFLIVVSLVIAVVDGRPIFFRQTRIGYHGAPFKILKFRSMIDNSRLPGPQITAEGDRRITTLGAILRKSKLDELPQLVNVLLGQMSFVGPRPEVPKYVNLYTKEQREVLNVPQGITDPASIVYFNEERLLKEAKDPEAEYINVILPEKIRINLEYANTASLWSDIKIIFKTFSRMLSRPEF